MWGLSDYIVIILAVLGIVFPAKLIEAIRSEDKDKSDECKVLACLCFGAIMFLIGALLNTIIHAGYSAI